MALFVLVKLGAYPKGSASQMLSKINYYRGIKEVIMQPLWIIYEALFIDVDSLNVLLIALKSKL